MFDVIIGLKSFKYGIILTDHRQFLCEDLFMMQNLQTMPKLGRFLKM